MGELPSLDGREPLSNGVYFYYIGAAPQKSFRDLCYVVKANTFFGLFKESRTSSGNQKRTVSPLERPATASKAALCGYDRIFVGDGMSGLKYLLSSQWGLTVAVFGYHDAAKYTLALHVVSCLGHAPGSLSYGHQHDVPRKAATPQCLGNRLFGQDSIYRPFGYIKSIFTKVFWGQSFSHLPITTSGLTRLGGTSPFSALRAFSAAMVAILARVAYEAEPR